MCIVILGEKVKREFWIIFTDLKHKQLLVNTRKD